MLALPLRRLAQRSRLRNRSRCPREWAVPAYPVAPLALLKLASEQAIELDKLRCWADAKHLVGSYVEPSRNH